MQSHWDWLVSSIANMMVRIGFCFVMNERRLKLSRQLRNAKISLTLSLCDVYVATPGVTGMRLAHTQYAPGSCAVLLVCGQEYLKVVHMVDLDISQISDGISTWVTHTPQQAWRNTRRSRLTTTVAKEHVLAKASVCVRIRMEMWIRMLIVCCSERLLDNCCCQSRLPPVMHL